MRLFPTSHFEQRLSSQLIFKGMACTCIYTKNSWLLLQYGIKVHDHPILARLGSDLGLMNDVLIADPFHHVIAVFFSHLIIRAYCGRFLHLLSIDVKAIDVGGQVHPTFENHFGLVEALDDPCQERVVSSDHAVQDLEVLGSLCLKALSLYLFKQFP